MKSEANHGRHDIQQSADATVQSSEDTSIIMATDLPPEEGRVIYKRDQPILIPKDRTDVVFDPPPGLTPDQSRQFKEIHREIRSDIEPDGFIERKWCRDLSGLYWRIAQLQSIREHFMQSRYEAALAEMLIARTNEDILALFDRRRDGDAAALQTLDELKAKFAITDDQIRSHIEIRHFDQITKIDQELRALTHEGDRIIELIEKRRFICMANARLKKSQPVQLNKS